MKSEQRRTSLTQPYRWRALGIALLLATTCTAQDGGLEVDPAKHPPEIGQSRQAVSLAFAANSLIIPMDNTYQDTGMLRAYGLVYKLLQNDIPVRWSIDQTKVSTTSWARSTPGRSCPGARTNASFATTDSAAPASRCAA